MCKEALSPYIVDATLLRGFVIIDNEYHITDENGECPETVTIAIPNDLNNLPPGVKYKNGKLYGKPKSAVKPL